MRKRIVVALVAALMAAGAVTAVAASDTTPVDCTIEANVLSCPLPEPPAPVTETVTETPAPVTQTVTETPAPVTATVTATTTVTAPAGPETLFGDVTPASPADPDNVTVELGVRFKPAVDGVVTGVRFYKGPANTGTHTGSLWSGTVRVATVTFTGETDSGWQTAKFATPVIVKAGTEYIASYLAPVGRYAIETGYAWPKVSGNLTGLGSLYQYGGGLPNATFGSSNYFVDVLYIPTGSAPTTTSAPPTTTATTTATSAPASTTNTPTTTTTPPPAGCDRTATNASTLTTQINAATAGQTICLAAGSYGVWAGTNKAVTIRAAAGVSASMTLSLDSNDNGFTLDGLSGLSGDVRAGAKNFTIRNSTFTDTLRLQGQPGANILIEGNKFDWNALDSDANAKLFLWTATYGQSSGVTIRGNSFRNGELDGIHIGNAAGGDIIGNHFENICYLGGNHADMLQTEGMVGGRIAQNLFKAGADCGAQGLTSFDSGTVGVVIEDNVIDVRRPWGIEWYSDKDSIIRNNTVVYYPPANCNFNTQCGRISINRKSEDPAGSGTQATDNLASVEFTNGSTGTSTGNVSSQGLVFVGPGNTWADYKLSPNSPGQGKGARIP